MSEQNLTNVKVVDVLGNPAPLGLLGFGMTTILLNIHNAGVYPLNSMIMGMGIMVGGIAQIFAGLMEYKKSNTFGGMAFTSYGAFWLSLIFIWILPKMGLATASDKTAMGFYLSMWGLYTLGMFFATFKSTKVTQFVFGSLVVLFFLLAIGDFTGNETITRIAGIEGIICGFSAFYDAIAQIINGTYGRVILPLGAKK